VLPLVPRGESVAANPLGACLLPQQSIRMWRSFLSSAAGQRTRGRGLIGAREECFGADVHYAIVRQNLVPL
jgi:hypothetical protein